MRHLKPYLANAIEWVENPDNLFVDRKTRLGNKTYKGYTAAFGTIVRQSGLMPAVILFAGKGGEKDDKSLIIKAIHHFLKQSGDSTDWKSDLVTYVISPENRDDKVKIKKAERKVLDASIALKLALRTLKYPD